MAISSGMYILDNFGVGKFYQKIDDNTLAKQTDAGVVVDGSFCHAQMVVGFTDQPKAYLYVLLNAMSAGGIYELYGAVAPYGAKVNLSVSQSFVIKDILFAIKEKEPIASVNSAETNGLYSFTDVAYEGGIYFAWIQVEPNYTSVSTASITGDIRTIVSPPGSVVMKQVDLQSSYTNWSGEISGQCPADASAVCLSRGYNESATLNELEEQLIASISPTESAVGGNVYSMYQNLGTSVYTVWCLTKKGGELTAIVNGKFYDASEGDDSTNPCLSGDTQIAMADGQTKRLDGLKAGDMILSRDGNPTKVTKTGRDVWQPFHTKYYFEDGTVIDEIADHRFYNVEQGFWQKLNRWNVGDHAVRIDGAEVALIKVERIDEEAECFGLWTESNDHFANGLLGGGAGANRPLLENATLEQAADMAISLDELEVEKMFFGGVL